jgi:hypothetical protein
VSTAARNREELCRGHLKECLVDLDRRLSARAPHGTKGASKAREPIAGFCAVDVQTVRVWLSPTGNPPDGATLFRLYCFLDLIGYRVIEFERMSNVRRNVVELLGFQVATIEDLVRDCGYTKTSILYQVLRGDAGASDDKEQRMWDAWKKRRAELEAAKTASAQKYASFLSAPPHVSGAKADATPLQKPRTGKPVRTQSNQEVVVSMMIGLLAFLEKGALDNLTDQELATLRCRATVLGLTVHLNRLSVRFTSPEQNGVS